MGKTSKNEPTFELLCKVFISSLHRLMNKYVWMRRNATSSLINTAYIKSTQIASENIFAFLIFFPVKFLASTQNTDEDEVINSAEQKPPGVYMETKFTYVLCHTYFSALSVVVIMFEACIM